MQNELVTGEKFLDSFLDSRVFLVCYSCIATGTAGAV